MPVAPVDINGSVLYYKDSGRPGERTDYVTLVLVHGAMFHSAIYRPMIPCAAQNNVRLVLLNLRDYPGSTPYTSTELDDLRGPSFKAQAGALQARGLELAAFLHWFITHEHITPITETPDGTLAGGIAILAWSAGNSHLLAFLAHADKVSAETKVLLGTHLRSVVLYDPSLTTVGAPPPEGLYSPLRDPALNPAAKVACFPTWVSSYFAPIDALATTEEDKPLVIPQRGPPRTNSEGDSGSESKTPTVTHMGADALAGVVDPGVMARSQFLFTHIQEGVYAANVRAALLDPYFADASGGRKMALPALRVHVVWCARTTGDCVWGAQCINLLIHQREYEGKGRDVQVHRLDGANHFIHWDDPERFAKFLASIV